MSSKPSSLQDHLGYWLRLVSNHVSLSFARKLEAENISVAEWVVLRELYNDDCAPSDLAEKMGMTRGAISKVVSKLTYKGFVGQKAAGGDLRFQRVSLTPAGQKMVPKLAALADANEKEFFGHLSTFDTRALAANLQDIALRHGWDTNPVD